MTRRDEDRSDLERPEEPEQPASPQRAAGDAAPLLLKFASGDPETVAVTSRVISRVVRTRGYYIPLDQRPDVIQEATTDLVRAVKKATFATDDEFLGFVRVVAHRRCVDWIRLTRKRAHVAPEIRQLVSPDDGLHASDRHRLAAEVFSKLREPCRQLLALRVGRDLTYGQLAGLLGRSEGALRTQCSYCLRQARKILERMRRRRKLVRLVDWRPK